MSRLRSTTRWATWRLLEVWFKGSLLARMTALDPLSFLVKLQGSLADLKEEWRRPSRASHGPCLAARWGADQSGSFPLCREEERFAVSAQDPQRTTAQKPVRERFQALRRESQALVRCPAPWASTKQHRHRATQPC